LIAQMNVALSMGVLLLFAVVLQPVLIKEESAN
jgi:hypothetical protein